MPGCMAGRSPGQRRARSGRYGVVDQVWTRPADRRRGLGTLLMTMLGNRAVSLGLTTGVLSATDDGRALYRSLGWAVRGALAGAFRGGPSTRLGDGPFTDGPFTDGHEFVSTSEPSAEHRRRPFGP